MFKRLGHLRHIPFYKKLILLVVFLIATLYPVYKNYAYGVGSLSYQRQLQFVNKQSEYYNPWQYRALCPLIIEGCKHAYLQTVDKIIPFEKIANSKDPVVLQEKKQKFIYTAIFVLLRAFLTACIYVLTFCFLAYFIKSNWLAVFAILFVSLLLGNGFNDSDLSFNTYTDVVLYLWMACVIVYKKNPWLIVAITILGALNRETSLLIPVLYALSQYYSNTGYALQELRFKGSAAAPLLITITSLLSFAIVFFMIRFYYGYRPSEPVGDLKIAVGIDMLKYNLSGRQGLEGLFENYGTGMLMLLPVVCFFTFRDNSLLLKRWFIFLFPVWTLIHLFTAVIAESRCFFVPVILLFIPMTLEKIEQQIFIASRRSRENNPIT